MRIEFVNHASVTFAHGAVRLLCDPWLEGTAFNEGWALLSPTAFPRQHFAGITHLWYSHEHPDHFSPRFLAGIPPERRSAIEVLFHESPDGKILRHCAALGFPTRALPAEGRVALGPDFHVRCGRWDHTDDSWLLVEADGRRVLDLNDCQVNTTEGMERLRSRVGEIDVLLTQFSIAAWDGNPEQLERRRAGARNMLERTVVQSRALGPDFVVPFASFVWFCHDENAFMNEAANRVHAVEAALRERGGGAPVVLYPGDVWEVGAGHDNGPALARYAADYASLETRPRARCEPVPFAALQEAAERFCRRVNGEVGAARLRLRMARLNAEYQRRRRPGWRGRVRAALQLARLRANPARLWLSDLERAAVFDLRRGLLPWDGRRDACHVALASDSLAYAFRFLWGGLTLQINGRFRELVPEGRRPLFAALWMADAMNREAGAEARPL